MSEPQSNEQTYNEWFYDLINKVYPTEPGMLNIGLLNKFITRYGLEQRLEELENLEQHTIAAQNPKGGVTLVSEWVPGSQVNNRISMLRTELQQQLKDSYHD